jgi:hypothetical protein
MESFQRFFAWFLAHKAAIGMFLASIAGIVAGAGTIYKNDDLIHIAAVIGLVATALGGAGMAKSDEFYRDRLNVIKTRLDRRNDDSLIPAKDLKKLVDKVIPDEPTVAEDVKKGVLPGGPDSDRDDV